MVLKLTVHDVLNFLIYSIVKHFAYTISDCHRIYECLIGICLKNFMCLICNCHTMASGDAID